MVKTQQLEGLLILKREHIINMLSLAIQQRH